MGIRRHGGELGRLARPVLAGALVAVATALGFAFGRRGDTAAGLVATALLALAAGLAAHRIARSLRAVETLALRDALTGLPNRVLLRDRIERAQRQAERNDGRFALVFVDLDGFKSVNDLWGHQTGDALLSRLARRLESVVRSSDTVARVGGDEFVVLSSDARSDEAAAGLADRIRTVLRRPFHIEGRPIEIDASIGWALFPSDGDTPDDLLWRADDQMYATKRGRHARRLRSGAADATAARELEAALADGQLLVHYQPIVELASGRPRSIEALVRRVDPVEGILLPDAFLRRVDGYPVMRELTLRVIGDALGNLARWRGQGHDLTVSVNVPANLLADERLTSGVAELLTAERIEPSALTFEVTTSGSGGALELDETGLARLRRLGVDLAIDDFGRAASLPALRTLPIHQVKIDAAFVTGLLGSWEDAWIVQALADLGHALGLEVVAEGVEHREAWRELHARGCDLAQGFSILPPVPVSELDGWLARSRAREAV